MTDTDDVLRMALNLARAAGYRVFPCGENKQPTRPKHEGGNGCHDASTDPATIAFLWHHWPGPLIGIATGEGSNVDVLDVDPKHVEALAWWQANYPRLPRTRAFATRSKGLHCYFLHRAGITNTQGKLCPGVDTRGDGGYAIFWFAAGLECRDHMPPQAWPGWLYDALTYRKPAPEPSARSINPNRAIDGVLRQLADAREGNRNGMLFWAACRLAEHGVAQRAAEELLIPIAVGLGLSEHEVRRTIASAQGRAAA